MLDRIGIVLNPMAGRGRARHIEKHLVEYLHKKRLPFKLERTYSPGHAKEIASRMGNEFKVILSVGGDGTANEVANGILGKNAALALLPIGSGNDFNRMIGIPNQVNQAIELILKGKVKLHDIGYLTCRNSLGITSKRYFINTLGIGLDAEIANETKNIRFLRGLPLYLLAALKALYKHSTNEYIITDGNNRYKERSFFICVGNGCFEGGGFKILPDAIPNDSYFDICLIREMKLLKALRLIPRLIKGNHKTERCVSTWKSRKIRIESKKPFTLHGDGEILGDNTIRVDIKVIKDKFAVVVP